MLFRLKNSSDTYRELERARLNSGVTLIELLVVMAIMMIVGGAALVMFQSHARHEATQQNLLEQTQNMRTAMNVVTSNIRMAGCGLRLLSQRVHLFVPGSIADPNVQEGGGWFRYAGEDDYGIRAIFGTDSGSAPNTSDTLTIFRADLESPVTIGRLRDSFTPGRNATIYLTNNIYDPLRMAGADSSGDPVNGAISDGDIIAVSDGLNTFILQADLGSYSAGDEVTDIDIGPRFAPSDSLSGLTLAPGASVYNLRDITFVTYYVDPDAMTLMADYHDATITSDEPGNARPHLMPVAGNIEDFQVAYSTRAQNSNLSSPYSPTINGDILDQSTWVASVQVGMVSRSRTVSEASGQVQPVTLMDHQSNTDTGYTRRVLTEITQVRNSSPTL